MASAREITVPLAVDHEFIERLLLETVYTGEGGSAEVVLDGRGCSQVSLSDPAVASRDGRLVVRSAARARLGAWVGRCMTLLDWQGVLEVLEEPRVDPAAPLIRFRVVDSSIAAESGSKGLTGRLWDLVKARVHPRLEELVVDLRRPLDELGGVLPLFLAQEDLSRTRLVLGSLSFANARVVDDGLAVDLRVDLSELPPQPPTTARPEPTLTVQELERWEAAWQRWDAFVTFAVLRLAQGPHSDKQVQGLRDVFLEARYDLARALRTAPTGDGDPVRRLFVRTWKRLRPLLRELSVGLPGEASLRYLSLIAAADALRAIDAIGPDVGVEISAEGLRRLARLLDPAAKVDPLRYDTQVDPALRDMLGFGTPLPMPTAVETPSVAPEPAARSILDWLVAPVAAAEQGTVAEAAALSRRLHGWAPTRADAGQYLPLALRLLDLSREEILAKRSLAGEFRPLFRSAVLATAWQESCWRQFVRKGNTVRTLTSSAGSLGVMQVNQHVWRGVYDVGALHKNFAYNAAAGTEILLHYMVDYAIKQGEHSATGNPDNLARASYAAYNGGPRHLRRYRKRDLRRDLREIDESFWQKFRAVKKGEELAVRQCYG